MNIIAQKHLGSVVWGSYQSASKLLHSWQPFAGMAVQAAMVLAGPGPYLEEVRREDHDVIVEPLAAKDGGRPF